LSALRWLFALGWVFFACAFSMRLHFEHGRLTDFAFLLQESPALLATCLGLAAACWIGYRLLRRVP
jgi:hypothetical protein